MVKGTSNGSPDGAAGAPAGRETAARSTSLVGVETAPPDFYGMDELLTEEERSLRDRVRAFVDADVLPIIADYWERAEFPRHLLPKVGSLGVMGVSIEGYGCPGFGAVADGLVSAELARGDVGLNTVWTVSNLAMRVICACGSEEQKERWLPPMARMEAMGAFALTEPGVGSDAGSIAARARRDGGAFVIDGRKRWIGNARDAEVVVVFARDDEGGLGAFLVEKDAPGVSAMCMYGKGSARVAPSFDLYFEGARVPVENRLERCRGFRDVGPALAAGRYNIACVALGQAMACYEAALAYALEREQFGRPIAAFQLVQQKLAWMLSEVTAMQLLCWRLGRLLDEGRMEPEQAALAKMNNARKAREIAAAARDVMGGNGILLENRVARHQADAEATYTYEGTDHVQTLVLGRRITGHNAFV